MSKWPSCKNSKIIIKLVENCEMTVFGDEMQQWSPTTPNNNNLIINRINKLLDEIGLVEEKNKKLYEKLRLISHHLGISFWDNNETDTESDEN